MGGRAPVPGSVHGEPWQFDKLTPHEHVPLYRRGIAMAAQHDLTTGLLVSMHVAGLYNDRYGTFRLAERQFSPAEQALVDEFLADRLSFRSPLPSGSWAASSHPRHDRSARLVHLPAVAGLGPPLAAVCLPAGG